MLFNSLAFFVFFALVLLIYWRLRSNDARKELLVAGSYFFYACWDYRFLALLGFVSAVAYFGALGIARSEGSRRRAILAVSIAALLSTLFFFKYYNFFTDSLARLLAALSLDAPSTFLNIILPVGISFYVFHAISYVVDVYRRELPPDYSLLDVALYIAFFPQLVAGPILRATQFLPQLKSTRQVDWKDVSEGTHLFVLGWCYKVVLADSLAEIVDPVFANPQEWSGGSYWIATLAYSGQIYFDFAGYSAMAIGTSLLLGYRMPRNFDYPYSALSITEFWRRWHISLSTWLRDYLFIPLGGSRNGRAQYFRNLMLTMVLGGLWHGASWNFVIWGFIHGFALTVHKLWMQHGLSVRGTVLWTVASLALTQVCVVLAWVFFRAQTLEQSTTMIAGMFGAPSGEAASTLHPALALVVALPVVADAVLGRWTELTQKGFKLRRWASGAALGGLVALLLWLHPLSSTPFIYFQF